MSYELFLDSNKYIGLHVLISHKEQCKVGVDIVKGMLELQFVE